MQPCCTTINETLRVYYRVTSLRKKRSEIYYGAKGLLRPKMGLVLPKFHSNEKLWTCQENFIKYFLNKRNVFYKYELCKLGIYCILKGDKLYKMLKFCVCQ